MRKRVAHEQALWYEEELQKEIAKDREYHGKKPLKEKDRNDPPSGSGGSVNSQGEIPEEQKHRSAVQLIRKADGFVRENINMFLLTQ